MQHGKIKLSPVEKELQKIEQEEEKLARNASRQADSPVWKSKLEERIPQKMLKALQKAFSKAFYIIFEKGTVLIEKTYNKDSVRMDFQINDYAMDIRGSRKEIRRIRSGAAGSNALNMAVATVEGMGLGALGIGLPDIAIWVGILLKGIYETALKYGYDYDSPKEKLFILKLIETAMLSGEKWIAADEEVRPFFILYFPEDPDEKELKEQIEKTANTFATEMLVTKFIQGLPVAGVIGGAANPVYYHKIMKYVQLRYHKRYLTGKIEKVN